MKNSCSIHGNSCLEQNKNLYILFSFSIYDTYHNRNHNSLHGFRHFIRQCGTGKDEPRNNFRIQVGRYTGGKRSGQAMAPTGRQVRKTGSGSNIGVRHRHGFAAQRDTLRYYNMYSADSTDSVLLCEKTETACQERKQMTNIKQQTTW